MSRILKVLLFIIAIFAFFEVGLFASYSLISSEPVNPVELISIQTEGIGDFISSVTSEKKLNDQDTLSVINDEDVALVLNNLTNLSVNLESVTAKISTDETGNQTVTITALAVKDSQSTYGGSIVITPQETYSITANATGEVYSSGKTNINTTTITLQEMIVLYNSDGTGGNLSYSNMTNSSIDELVEYTRNATNNSTNRT